jgi:hypothetical protein
MKTMGDDVRAMEEAERPSLQFYYYCVEVLRSISLF